VGAERAGWGEHRDMSSWAIRQNKGYPGDRTIEMNAERMPAWLAERGQIVRERQERLRAAARDARLARPGRERRSSSRTWTRGFGMVVRMAGVGATGGTDR
jgi:hypothetical protein